MPINAEWGDGGTVGGGSAVAIGTDFDPVDGAAVNADGTRLPIEVVVGQGGVLCGGEAEVG